MPGTCTIAGWESLPDGVRWGVAGVGVKDSTTGKYLENRQTEPDLRLMNEYGVVITGKDQQLEAAVTEMMKLVTYRNRHRTCDAGATRLRPCWGADGGTAHNNPADSRKGGRDVA